MDYKKEYWRIEAMNFDCKPVLSDGTNFDDGECNSHIERFCREIDTFVEVEQRPLAEQRRIAEQEGYESIEEYFASLQNDILCLYYQAQEDFEEEYNNSRGNQYKAYLNPSSCWKHTTSSDFFYSL